MADIFKEVDEELRREQAAKFWKRHGRALIAGAAAIVLAVAGYQGWKAYDLSQREDRSDRFAAALERAEASAVEGIDALAALSDPAGGGYAGLAAFEEARLRVESGDLQGAIALWERIAAESDLGPPFREAATLLAVQHQLDTAPPDELRARLQPLMGAGRPYRNSARELAALIALRQGDHATAREHYTAIADDRNAPSGLRSRATQMLAFLKD